MLNSEPTVPEMVALPKASALFGLSRSGLYRLAAAGQIRMVKIGSRTLVDASSVRGFLRDLPEAQLRREPNRSNDHLTVRNPETK